jgi:hypothetical protein
MKNAHMYMISNKRFDIGETTRVVGSWIRSETIASGVESPFSSDMTCCPQG